MASSSPLIFSSAVNHFWSTREAQARRQAERGGADQGARSAVTGGKQLDRFLITITDYLIQAGVDPTDIYTRTTELPGFFRPTKEWDLVVVIGGHLVAAIELKSQVGPSFGNNFNNRTEEAMGSALDIWTAYREGAFRLSPQPWLGYLLLVEDCPESRRPVSLREPLFQAFPEFRETSYLQRYELFCRKLVRERHYTSACMITTSREHAGQAQNYAHPSLDLSGESFLSQLVVHARGALSTPKS